MLHIKSVVLIQRDIWNMCDIKKITSAVFNPAWYLKYASYQEEQICISSSFINVNYFVSFILVRHWFLFIFFEEWRSRWWNRGCHSSLLAWADRESGWLRTATCTTGSCDEVPNHAWQERRWSRNLSHILLTSREGRW